MVISDCHFRKPGIKWLNCTEKWQSDITLGPPWRRRGLPLELHGRRHRGRTPPPRGRHRPRAPPGGRAPHQRRRGARPGSGGVGGTGLGGGDLVGGPARRGALAARRGLLWHCAELQSVRALLSVCACERHRRYIYNAACHFELIISWLGYELPT
jgi:hypothetical protein